MTIPLINALRLLTTAEAAEQLGMTPRSVARLCKAGALKAIKKGRDYQVDPQSVEAYKTADHKPGWQLGRKRRASSPAHAQKPQDLRQSYDRIHTKEDVAMDNERIQRIATMAGVSFERAYDWILDPNGDWQNSAEPVSADEHAAWVESASDEEIAGWLADGAR